MLYPSINCHHLSHPVAGSISNTITFDIEKFKLGPSIFLLGSWLRDYHLFCARKLPFAKKILYKPYTETYIRYSYSKYSSFSGNILDRNIDAECVEFLPNDEYDRLLTKSLVYLCLHDTSANNVLIECMISSTPFINIGPHPAVVEYIGSDYPLFLSSKCELEHISLDLVEKAHLYLKQRRDEYIKKLSMSNFLNGLGNIISKLN